MHFSLRTVTLPDGVVAGQTIHVQAPDGRVNAIVVPPGFGPGSTFTVEFAPDTAATVPAPYVQQASAPPMAPAAMATNTAPSPYDPMAKPMYNGTAPTATATAVHDPNYTVPPNPSRPDDGFASGFGR